MVTSALEGMRVLSMQWVMIGHTFLFFKGDADNVLTVEAVETKRWTMQTIDNGTYSVDTFFALSGFLLAYVSLGKLHGMRKKQIAKEEAAPSVLRHAGTIGMMVVHRWLRLVPSLGMVMLMNAQLLSHVSDEPLTLSVTLLLSLSFTLCLSLSAFLALSTSVPLSLSVSKPLTSD